MAFGGFHAVSDVSLEVRSGECVGILGSNGAGKTTLFNILNGVLRPDSGTVEIFGQRLGSAHQRLPAGRRPDLQDLRLVGDLAA